MMLDENSQAEMNAVSRTTAIVVLAMCAAIVAFGIYVLFLFVPNQERETGALTPLVFGFSLLQLLLSFTIPRAIANRSRKSIADGTWPARGDQEEGFQTDAGKLGAVYQRITIVSSALLESAALLALTAYMLEGHFSSLVAACVMLMGIASSFPIGDRLTAWTEHELRILKEERSLKRSK